MLSRIHEHFIAAVVIVLFAVMVVIPIVRGAAALMDDHANLVAERSIADNG